MVGSDDDGATGSKRLSPLSAVVIAVSDIIAVLEAVMRDVSQLSTTELYDSRGVALIAAHIMQHHHLPVCMAPAYRSHRP